MAEKRRKMFVKDLIWKNNHIDWIASINREVRFIYDDIEGTVKLVRYIKEKHNKIAFIYNEEEFVMVTDMFKNCNLGCVLGKHNKAFMFEINQNIKDEKRDLTIINRKYDKETHERWYEYKCNKCTAKIWTREENLKKYGCRCCANQIVIKGINDVATTNPSVLPYLANQDDGCKLSKGSNKKVKAKCIYCKSEKMVTMNELCSKGFSCRFCGDGISFPEKLMINILNKLNIEFVREYSPEWIKPKRYDFYIPSMKLIIEMDGKLGHGISTYDGKTSVEESLLNDLYKDNMAKENNLEIIRIDCCYSSILNRFDYIKNHIINSSLTNFLNLNKINWDELNRTIVDNMAKTVCDYWHIHNEVNKENLSVGDVVNFFKHYNASLIRQYLKMGTKFGWCNYDPIIEKSKVSRKNSLKNAHKIKIFKNGKLIGTFKYVKDLIERSEELYGIKITRPAISISIKKNKSYKGFTFEYIEGDK